MSEYPSNATNPFPSYPPPPVPPPAARRRGRRTIAAVALLATVALTGGAAGAATTALAYQHGNAAVVTSATVSAVSGSAEPLSQVAAAVQPSVVTITARSASGEGIGSGVVYRSDGVILTNDHVVADAANGGTITVTLSTGRTVTADLVGQDATNDLALIKAQGVTGLTPVTFGSLGDVAIGDTVLAFGSPLGLAGSVSAGIVSALGRTVTIGGNPSTSSPYGGIGSVSNTEVLHNAIQTDATINPGNSGGPLVDTSGRLIGIDTAIASTGSQSGSIGVGFAIPVTTVKAVAERLVRAASV